MAKKLKFPVFFSCKRAFGITIAKRKVSKAAEIPTSRLGVWNKVGRLFGIN